MTLSILYVLLLNYCCLAMTNSHRLILKERTKDMFSDAFDSYMKYAYPLDELDPINCKGNSRTKDSQDWYVNDVLGNYSLTLVDSLDALAIFGKQKEFEQSVKRVIQTVSFSKDVRVQVFEVTIRVLGGLLSAHLLATDATLGFKIDWYNGELLDLAEDLGQRLLPAFDTPFGIPYPRVNLKSGVMSYEVREACVAGAGTLILEFGALSRLTGNYIYEEKAKIALFEIWRRRTDIGLVGNTMNIFSETWVDEMSGVGAGSDSFFEYLFKAYVLLGGKEYLDTYQSAYEAIMKHIVDGDGFIFKSVSAFSGKMITAWVDSLSAFFPGLQVLSGHLEDSIHPHLLYATIWKKYGALPERFNFQTKSSVLDYYPLRPELIESTYMLYQATKDHFYLELGERILNDIQTHAKVKCGYASIKNVEHKTHDPRMESFFLSETLKYLYLLFDADNIVNKVDNNAVFTTEGHYLPLPHHLTDLEASSSAMQTCKAFSHRKVFHQGPPVTKSALQLCADFVGVTIYNSELQKSSVPLPNDPIDVIVPTTTLNPSSGKLVAYKNLVFLDSLHGVSFTVKPSNTQQYSLVKIGKTPSIKTSIAVVLQDTLQSSPMVIHNNDPFLAIISYKDKKDRNKIDLLAVPAIFGPILSHGSAFNLKVIILRKRAMMGNEPTAVSDVGTGCVAYSSRQASEIMGKILVVARGSCNFYVKVKFAETAGARAVIVVGDQTKSTTMGAPQPFDTLVDDLTIPSFFVPYPNSQKLLHDKPSLVSISIVFGDLLKAKKFSNYQTSVNGVPINGIMFVNLRHELPAHDGIYRNDYITANPLTRIKCLSKCYQEVCCE